MCFHVKILSNGFLNSQFLLFAVTFQPKKVLDVDSCQKIPKDQIHFCRNSNSSCLLAIRSLIHEMISQFSVTFQLRRKRLTFFMSKIAFFSGETFNFLIYHDSHQAIFEWYMSSCQNTHYARCAVYLEQSFGNFDTSLKFVRNF